MTYSVGFTASAARQLRRLDRPVRVRVVAAIGDLAEEQRPVGATKLVGEQSAWRIRVGGHPVLYDVLDESLVVTVVGAGHGREVYDR